MKDIQVMKADGPFDILQVLYAENALLLVNIKNGVGMFVYGAEAVNLFKHKLGMPSYDCGKEAYFRIRHKARLLPQKNLIGGENIGKKQDAWLCLKCKRVTIGDKCEYCKVPKSRLRPDIVCVQKC